MLKSFFRVKQTKLEQREREREKKREREGGERERERERCQKQTEIFIKQNASIILSSQI